MSPAARSARTGFSPVRTMLSIAVAVAFALPVAWVIISSLRPERDILAHLSPLNWEAFIPSEITLDNYTGLVQSGFMQGVVNSILVAGITIVLGLLVCAPAAFALSALRFPGRNLIFALLVVSFSVPFDILAIPLAQLVRGWGLSNTIIALVLPGIGNGFAIFLLRQFFLAIPTSLVEAARVDGASWLRVLFQIYLPMSRSVLVGAGLIIFTFQWQAYLWPLLAATASDAQLAPTRLAALSSLYDANTGQVLAGAAVLAVIPAIVLLVFQRYFVLSTSTSGVNG